jgi:hypothetical protein
VGDVRAAKQVAVDALAAWQQPKRVAMQWSASNEPPQAAGSSSSSSTTSSTSGIQYASSWQRIVDFVAAETMAALRGGRLKQRRGGGSSSSSSSGSQGLVATGVADPVYLMPSEWLDELVGWQLGRRVKVCFNVLKSSKGKEGGSAGDQDEEEDISTTYADSKGRVEVMLQDSDGRRTDFNWGQEGDAHEVNMWKAMQDTLNSDDEDEEEDEEEDWVIEGDAGQGTISTTPWPGNPSITVQQALLGGLDDIMNGIFGINVNSSTGGGARPAATPAAAAAAASAGQAKAATTPAAATPAAAAAAAAASRGAGAAVTVGAVVQQAAGTKEPGPAAAPARGGGSSSSSSSSSNTPPTQSSRAAAVGPGAGGGGGQQALAQQATAQQPAPGAARGLKPCAWCGTQLPKLQKCSRCKRVGYCCKEHQVEHWPTHKQECAAASDAQ